MLGVTLKDIVIKESNSNGICNKCNTKNIFYSILNGRYVYYCHTCKKWVDSNNIK